MNIGDEISIKNMVVSNKVVLDRPLLEQAENLRLICVAATGTNNIDLAAARERKAAAEGAPTSD